MSFTQLVTKYRIPKQDFLKYLQLRSCILSAQREFPLLLQTELQKLVQGNQGAKGWCIEILQSYETISPTKAGGPQESMG